MWYVGEGGCGRGGVTRHKLFPSFTDDSLVIIYGSLQFQGKISTEVLNLSLLVAKNEYNTILKKIDSLFSHILGKMVIFYFEISLFFSQKSQFSTSSTVEQLSKSHTQYWRCYSGRARSQCYLDWGIAFSVSVSFPSPHDTASWHRRS